MAYGWPGNVRELQNCVERAVILCDDAEIGPPHLSLTDRYAPPAAVVDPWQSIDLSGNLADASKRILAEVERRKIQQALDETVNNTGLAADALQINHRTLTAKMQEYGIGVR
ncbi:MAG: helix-turn-helix domain-containing protein [Acidobacteriota bacterium]|nr:helix-turn-helix domain-containing protein [Acidobacteriota bacterium]